MSMNSHDLDMANPQKVFAILEDCKGLLSKLNTTVGLVTDMADTDLKIGNLGASLKKVSEMTPSIEGVQKVFDQVNDDIQSAVRGFETAAGDGTF